MGEVKNRPNSVECRDTDFLFKLSVELTADIEYKTNINKALRIISKYSECDRISIIKINNNMTFSILHEWRSEQAMADTESVKKYKYYLENEISEKLDRDNYIWIEDVDKLKSPGLKKILKNHSIKSTVIFPLFTKQIFSFIAFSECRNKERTPSEIQFMMDCSSIIAANLEKNLLIYSLVKKIKKLRKNNSDDQIVKIKETYAITR